MGRYARKKSVGIRERRYVSDSGKTEGYLWMVHRVVSTVTSYHDMSLLNMYVEDDIQHVSNKQLHIETDYF